MQFRPVFQVLGPFVRDRSRSVAPHRERGGAGALAGAGLIGIAAAAVFAAASPALAKIESHGDVTIKVTDLRSADGVVRACMTTREDVFPKCADDPEAYRIIVPAKKNVTLTFNDVKPGNYAIALLHDENGNGKADRALGMMPKEGYGFSRDAPVKMAPPKFRDAVFPHGTTSQNMTIKMRYFL